MTKPLVVRPPPSPLRSSLAIFKRKIPLQFHQYEILVATATYDFI